MYDLPELAASLVLTRPGLLSVTLQSAWAVCVSQVRPLRKAEPSLVVMGYGYCIEVQLPHIIMPSVTNQGGMILNENTSPMTVDTLYLAP